MLASVGVVTQLVGVVLLAAFLLVLRRYADVRGYFGPWTWAWVAYATGLAAIVARYFAAAAIAPPVGRLLDAAYFLGKLAFFLALLVGALRFAGRAPRVAVPAIAATAYAAIALLESRALDALVGWQAPVAVASAAASAALVLACPTSRRSVGSRIVGASLAFLTALWTLYGVSFLAASGELRPTAFLHFLSSYNSFIDLIVAVVLSFGMAVLVLEDAKRSADDAHAELARAHEVLRKSAVYDTLTGALNRRAFREAAAVGELGVAGAVVVVDLDDLKFVNDAHGHAAGDRLLALVASALARALPDEARLYRWGGDEFVVVAPGAAAPAIARIVARAIDDAEPLGVDTGALPLAASFGVSGYASAAELERAITRADESMYVDKLRRKGTPVRAMMAIRALA